MMSSSSGAPLDALRALSSINSAGIVPAFGQLAQRGAMGGYPAAMLQQQGMQQYLSNLPWMLRMQVVNYFHRNLTWTNLLFQKTLPLVAHPYRFERCSGFCKAVAEIRMSMLCRWMTRVHAATCVCAYLHGCTSDLRAPLRSEPAAEDDERAAGSLTAIC